MQGLISSSPDLRHDSEITAMQFNPSSAIPASRQQATLANPISCSDIGLHSGHHVNLILHPAPADFGICFQRSDIAGSPLIPARYDHVIDTRLSTVIGIKDADHIRVATIEHLMSALHANGITNALVQVDGAETPVFDGSAAAFDFLIRCAGRQTQSEAAPVISICRAVKVTGKDGAFAELRPRSGAFCLDVSIEFPAKAIGFQQLSVILSESTFRRDICDSRTFVNLNEIEALQAAGLARGGSLDNAVVVDGATIVNAAGFRHADECVRHKILDAIGDMYLAGGLIEGHFIGHKCGHDLNNRLLHALFSDNRNWKSASTSKSMMTGLHAVA